MVDYSKKKYRTVLVKRDLVEKLKSHKLVDMESYNSVIERMLIILEKMDIDLSKKEEYKKYFNK